MNEVNNKFCLEFENFFRLCNDIHDDFFTNQNEKYKLSDETFVAMRNVEELFEKSKEKSNTSKLQSTFINFVKEKGLKEHKDVTGDLWIAEDASLYPLPTKKRELINGKYFYIDLHVFYSRAEELEDIEINNYPDRLKLIVLKLMCVTTGSKEIFIPEITKLSTVLGIEDSYYISNDRFGGMFNNVLDGFRNLPLFTDNERETLIPDNAGEKIGTFINEISQAPETRDTIQNITKSISTGTWKKHVSDIFNSLNKNNEGDESSKELQQMISPMLNLVKRTTGFDEPTPKSEIDDILNESSTSS